MQVHRVLTGFRGRFGSLRGVPRLSGCACAGSQGAHGFSWPLRGRFEACPGSQGAHVQVQQGAHGFSRPLWAASWRAQVDRVRMCRSTGCSRVFEAALRPLWAASRRAQVVRVRMCRFTGCSRVFEATSRSLRGVPRLSGCACAGPQGAHRFSRPLRGRFEACPG